MNTPKIRFKGFEDDWEQRKLGDVAQEFKSGNSLKADEIDITGDYPVYGGNGLRGYTSTYNHDGEYALIGRQGALCGNMNYSAGKAYFTEHAVVVKADENNDTRFLYYMLDRMNLGQYSDQSAQPGLAVNKLVKLENSFPKKEEQQQIGTYFRSLDHLITLHQRKCDETKQLKKFMLQKMFPKNGEKNPEIRFEGFTDDWEQRKVSDLLQERNEQAPRSEEYPLMAFIADQGVAPKGERYDRSALVNDENGKKYKRTEYGDFIYSSNNLETGSIGLNKYGNASISPVYSIFKRTSNVDLDFLGRRFLRKDFINEMVKWRQGVVYGQWKIHESDFLKINVVVPSIEEQKRIGHCFEKLDHLITLHQRKCEKLKELKKFMLQNMFV